MPGGCSRRAPSLILSRKRVPGDEGPDPFGKVEQIIVSRGQLPGQLQAFEADLLIGHRSARSVTLRNVTIFAADLKLSHYPFGGALDIAARCRDPEPANEKGSRATRLL